VNAGLRRAELGRVKDGVVVPVNHVGHLHRLYKVCRSWLGGVIALRCHRPFNFIKKSWFYFYW
jgi:hypothetical protein